MSLINEIENKKKIDKKEKKGKNLIKPENKSNYFDFDTYMQLISHKALINHNQNNHNQNNNYKSIQKSNILVKKTMLKTVNSREDILSTSPSSPSLLMQLINNSETKMETKMETKIKSEKEIETKKELYYPNMTNFRHIFNKNLNIKFLREIVKKYKLRASGNKQDLTNRIYSHLFFTKNILIIQRVFRGYIQRMKNWCQGPALINRSICVNETDFISMEKIDEIDSQYFFSFKDDTDNSSIYGFHLGSIYQYVIKNKVMQNPYNRKPFPEKVKNNIEKTIKLSVVLGLKLNLEIEEPINLTVKKQIELRALKLFQTINELGNYSNVEWFLTLNKQQIIQYLNELRDLWDYRADLLPSIKREIIPPSGDLFQNFHIRQIENEQDIYIIKKNALSILERLIFNNASHENKSLGAIYILGILTLISDDAASSLPGLYQAFQYIV